MMLSINIFEIWKKEDNIGGPKPTDRSRPLPQTAHTIGVEVGLKVGEYAAKKGAEYLYSRPYKLFPSGSIRPQAFRWGFQRFLGRAGRFLGTKAGGISILGPLIDLFTSSDTIPTNAGEKEFTRIRDKRAEDFIAKLDHVVINPDEDLIHHPKVMDYIEKHGSLQPLSGHEGFQYFLRRRAPFESIADQISIEKESPKFKKSMRQSRPIDPFSGKPRRSVLEVKPHTPLDPKYHWVFPPEVIARSRPESNFLKSLWLQGINKPKPSQPLPPKTGFIDPIKLAAQKLQTTPAGSRPIFESSTDLLKHMEKQAQAQQRTQQWLRNVSQQLNKGFQARPFQAQPMVRGGSINPLRDMWERGINKSRPSPFGFPKTGFVDPIKQAAQNLRTTPGPARPIFESSTDLLKHMERQAIDQQKTQQWLRNVSRDLNRGFPSKPIQPRSMMGQGAPPFSSLRNMWEMGVRSRPVPNPLRMMSQGLK